MSGSYNFVGQPGNVGWNSYNFNLYASKNNNPVHTFLYLALVLQIVSMTYLISLICAGQFFLSFFNQHRRYAAALWFLVGALLMGFAGKLLLY